MPDNDVKIHVSADGDLKKIEEAQKKIQQLHKAADAYEARGDMDTAARSARSDARALERDVARWTKDRAADEKQISRELKEQDTLKKAGIRGGARTMAGGVQFAQNIAQGGDAAGTVAGGFLQMGMRSGSPLAMGAAIIAAVAVGLKGVFDKERDLDTAQGMELQERSAGRTYRRGRNAGVFGSSGALVGSALSADEDIAQRMAARASIDEKAREKWYDPSSWTWFGARKNAGQREREVNEAEIADLEKQKEKDTAAARKKFTEEEGRNELMSLRGRAQRSLAGSREAMVAEMGAEWLAKYKSTMAASGDAGLSKEMADLTVQNTLRDRQAAAGASLVDARSGGAEIAAAAQWSMRIPGMTEVGEHIKSLHATVQSQMNPIAELSKK